MKGTEIGYLYRDAANYKFRGTVRLSGSVALTDIQALLLDGEYLVPQRVGIPNLVPAARNLGDHELHEIEYVKAVDVSRSSLTCVEFLSRLSRANTDGWFDGTS